MKALARITLLVAGLAAAALPTVNAADATAPAPAAKHPRLRAMLMVRRAVRQRVLKKLGLSADQVTQLKADRAKTATAVKAIRFDSSLTPDQKKAKVREAMQAARTEMRSVLTPDQQAKLQQLRARRGAGP
jgi:Spy/CpxP family protein refolding chaperone